MWKRQVIGSVQSCPLQMLTRLPHDFGPHNSLTGPSLLPVPAPCIPCISTCDVQTPPLISPPSASSVSNQLQLLYSSFARTQTTHLLYYWAALSFASNSRVGIQGRSPNAWPMPDARSSRAATPTARASSTTSGKERYKSLRRATT